MRITSDDFQKSGLKPNLKGFAVGAEDCEGNLPTAAPWPPDKF